MAADEQWEFDTPTEAGAYWFHGWTSNFSLRMSEQETILVYVNMRKNGKLTFFERAQFLYPKEMYGVWCKARIPTPPQLNAEDWKARITKEQ